MTDKKVALAITIIRELGKGKIWRLRDYSIGMAEDYTIGFVLTKENGDQTIGGLSTLTFKDIVELAEKHGVDGIIPTDAMGRILMHAENMDW